MPPTRATAHRRSSRSASSPSPVGRRSGAVEKSMSANLAEPLRQLPQRRVIAVFDLDGTVTNGDTLIPFLRFAVGDLAFALRLPLLLPILAAMALHLLSRQRAKELVIGLYLGGMP